MAQELPCLAGRGWTETIRETPDQRLFDTILASSGGQRVTDDETWRIQ